MDIRLDGLAGLESPTYVIELSVFVELVERPSLLDLQLVGSLILVVG